MTAANNGADMDFMGQVALVTGGGRGIGRATAQALAAAGAAVGVLSRSQDQVAETVELVRNEGGRALAVPADVTDPRAVHNAVAEVGDKFGPVDLLVNGAGIQGPIGQDWEVDPDLWWRHLEINLRGPFVCATAVLPGMVARGTGRIVNVVSGAATRPFPYDTAYSTSKAGLTHWTESLAGETDRHGIKVFAYDPGGAMTAMLEDLADAPEVRKWFGDMFRRTIDEKRYIPMERVVDGLLFLASGRADALSGRFLGVRDDLEDLARRAEDIRRDDTHALRVRR